VTIQLLLAGHLLFIWEGQILEWDNAIAACSTGEGTEELLVSKRAHNRSEIEPVGGDISGQSGRTQEGPRGLYPRETSYPLPLCLHQLLIYLFSLPSAAADQFFDFLHLHPVTSPKYPGSSLEHRGWVLDSRTTGTIRERGIEGRWFLGICHTGPEWTDARTS
jgi:hypothetical protein